MLSKPDPQRMNDIAQIRQHIDLLTQRIITFRIQQQEIFDIVIAQLTADRDRARETGNKGNGRNYRGGCGFTFYPSPHILSNEEYGGYDGPPIFDEEIDNSILEVGYDEPPKFDEEIGGYNGPPIFDTEGDDTISMVSYEKPPKFDEAACGYDGPPILANEDENRHTHEVMQHDLNPGKFLSNTKKEILPFKDIDFGLSIFFKPMGRFIEIV